MKLELGGGERTAPGFVNVDVNPRTAHVVASALALPFRDGSAEEMRAVDLLEHQSYRDADRVLAEWARVLAPGAPIYVQVPDADKIMRDYAHYAGPGSSLECTEWKLLGGHLDGKYCKDGDDFRWNAHFSLWSRRKLSMALERAGITVERIVTNPHPNLCCDGRRR